MQKGFKDVFRERHPEIEAYTYWNYLAKGRGRNGWRIDFFLVCPRLAACLCSINRMPCSYLL